MGLCLYMYETGEGVVPDFVDDVLDLRSTFEFSLSGHQILVETFMFVTSEKYPERCPLGSSCVVDLLHLLHWSPST